MTKAKAVPQMKRAVWPIKKIVDCPTNPRTHPPAQIELLAQLLKRFGPDQDIVVDEGGVILKGHGRKLAAIKAEMKTFPVTIRLGMSDADKVAMRISDNQVSLLSGWDKELIKAQIGDLKAAGYDVPLLGFGDAQIVQFMTTPGPPAGFPTFGENIPTEFCCPRCHYSWSGQPKPPPEKPAKEPKAKKKK